MILCIWIVLSSYDPYTLYNRISEASQQPCEVGRNSYAHFTDGKTETQGDLVISHRKSVAELEI